MNPYTALLTELYARQPPRLQLGLQRIERLLELLEAPHRRMRRVVIAGTNGKGSTSVLVAGALQAAGHRVGLFTSPHLLRFTERIRVQGVQIAPDVVVQEGRRILAVAAAHGVDATFFEVTLALALVHFAACGVDAAVLEVGLGGRLDATNLPGKHLAAITSIGWDHQDILGSSLAAIAEQKAGIIEPGCPVVVAPQGPEAAAAIAAVARDRGAPLLWARPDSMPAMPDAPPYQAVNLAVAQTVCAALDARGTLRCQPQHLAQAAASFVWPGRYQWLRPGGPTRVTLPCPVVLDGGHNAAGAQALAAALAADPRVAGRPVHLLFGTVAGKDSGGMYRALAPRIASCRVCAPSVGRGRNPQGLADELGASTRPFAGFADAWADLAAHATPDAVAVVCGSLFLVADALAHFTDAQRDGPIAS